MGNPAKMFRIALAGLLLSTSVFLDGCAGLLDGSKQSYHASVAQSRTSSRDHSRSDIVPLDQHGIRAENNCELAGVQKIIDLMHQSQLEFMLAYLPDRESPDRCQWIEIGRGRYDGKVEGATVELDRKFLSRLVTIHKTLHLYHSHPLIYFESCRGEMSCENASVPMTAEKLSEDGLLSNLRYAMPSPSDIAFMMDVSREFDKHHHGSGRIRNRVVTPYGVVGYSLTQEGKERLAREGMEGEKGRYGFDTYLRTRVSYVLAEMDAIVGENPTDMRNVLTELARRLSNEYLLVSYTSWTTFVSRD